mgnify:CR=1 FL=1
MIVGVVTPVRNAAEHITETIHSVLDQTAVAHRRVKVRYVIQDGDSTDGTADRARLAADGRATVVSTPDNGMYDALARGFAEIESQGGADWYCYLNSGDLWDPQALDLVRHVADNTNASWLCGLHSYFSTNGSLVHTKLPFRYRQELLRAGAYGRGLPTIQQESTFWHRDLHASINTETLSSFAVAGDSYLWWTFAERSEPTIIEALLGGFRYHGNHLGVSKAEYRSEIERICGPLPPIVRARIPAERALWEQPARIKGRLNPNLLRYDISTGGWRGGSAQIPPL